MLKWRLGMCRRSLGMSDVQKLEKLCRELVDEFLATICVNLSQNSEFCKPISVNGIGYGFSILAGNRSDHSILSECISDAKYKFLVTVHCDHWVKKICMNPEIWTVQNGKRGQWSPLVCGFFLLLAAEADVFVFSSASIRRWRFSGMFCELHCDPPSWASHIASLRNRAGRFNTVLG